MNLAWTAGSNGTRFGIAAKYQLDSSASISVSVSFTSPMEVKVSLLLVNSLSQKCVSS